MRQSEPGAIKRLSLAAIIVIGVILLLRGLAPGPASAPNYSGENRGPEVVIDVAPGDTGSEIAGKLFTADVVKSKLAFFRVAVADDRSTRIAPGSHRLDSRISAREALDQLLDPNRIVNLVRVRDGARVNEVVDALMEAGYSSESIRAALKKIQPPKAFKARTLEGFLYPAFYAPTKDSTALDLIEKMVKRFNDSTADLSWEYGDFTPLELLTIASLVETEGTPDVHAKVARVIYNRLKIGMPLQLDSTIHYLKNRRGEIALSIADTKTPSPYNTYLNRGLPPGPIGSPTRASILAALDPADGEWLYFVTVSPKETKFTNSYEEFLKFKSEYQRNYRAGLFE